jgi:hypothetical protein
VRFTIEGGCPTCGGWLDPVGETRRVTDGTGRLAAPLACTGCGREWILGAYLLAGATQTETKPTLRDFRHGERDGAKSGCPCQPCRAWLAAANRRAAENRKMAAVS